MSASVVNENNKVGQITRIVRCIIRQKSTFLCVVCDLKQKIPRSNKLNHNHRNIARKKKGGDKKTTPEQGLEPWTLRLKVWCSTDWAIRATQRLWARSRHYANQKNSQRHRTSALLVLVRPRHVPGKTRTSNTETTRLPLPLHFQHTPVYLDKLHVIYHNALCC